jgi:hypothetical protein
MLGGTADLVGFGKLAGVGDGAAARRLRAVPLLGMPERTRHAGWSHAPVCGAGWSTSVGSVREVPSGLAKAAHTPEVSRKPDPEGGPSEGPAPVADVSRAPVAVSPAGRAASVEAPANPRAALVAELAGHMARLLAAGDVEGARITHDVQARPSVEGSRLVLAGVEQRAPGERSCSPRGA